MSNLLLGSLFAVDNRALGDQAILEGLLTDELSFFINTKELVLRSNPLFKVHFAN